MGFCTQIYEKKKLQVVDTNAHSINFYSDLGKYEKFHGNIPKSETVI